MALPQIPSGGTATKFDPNKPKTPIQGGTARPPVNWTPAGGGPGIPHTENKIVVNGPGKAPAPKTAVPKKPAAKPKPKPKKLSDLDKWLAADTTYQQQLAEFNKSRGDYDSTYNRQTGITNRDYAETQRSLDRQGQQDRMDQQNDFAGRGILKSGVFAQALGDYNTEFNQRTKGLVTGKNDRLGDMSEQRNNFLRQLQLEMNAAKQDAIRRRAQKLGI